MIEKRLTLCLTWPDRNVISHCGNIAQVWIERLQAPVCDAANARINSRDASWSVRVYRYIECIERTT